MNSRDALEQGGLGWTLDKLPLQAVRADGSTVAVADRFGFARSDTGAVLSVMSDGYRPFQNCEAFKFMDDIVGEGLAIWDSVGALKGGRKVFMLCKLPREIRITANDVVKPYVLLVKVILVFCNAGNQRP